MKNLKIENGLITRCCVCRRLETIEGNWVEEYLSDDNEDVTDTYCPTCYEAAKTLYINRIEGDHDE